MPRGHVRDADRRVGHVDVLPTGAARAVGVDPDVFLVDLHVDVFRKLRPDVERGERGVPPRGLIERRDPHEAVHAGLGRQQPIGVIAGDRERRALQARLVARLIVDQLPLEPAALGPSQVHAQQHFGPVLRFGPARPRMDRDNRILPVVLAAEHLLDLARLDLLIERVERGGEFAVNRLPRVGPLDQDRRGRRSSCEATPSGRGPVRGAGGAAGPFALRPGLSRNRARRFGPRGGSALPADGRLQR